MYQSANVHDQAFDSSVMRETTVKIGWIFAVVFAIHLVAVLYLVLPRGGPEPEPAEDAEVRERDDPESEDRTLPEADEEDEEEPDYIVYEVRRGDSLSVIARRHGTTVSEIRRLNALTGDVIHPGQELLIPGEEQ